MKNILETLNTHKKQTIGTIVGLALLAILIGVGIYTTNTPKEAKTEPVKKVAVTKKKFQRKSKKKI